MKEYIKPNIQVYRMKATDYCEIGANNGGESGPVLGDPDKDPTKATGGWYDEDYDW